ncbi:hypothetical protein ACA910_022290 [Epithemia clementina (nom. ined.)]
MKTTVPTNNQSKYDNTTSTTLVEPPRWCIVQPSSEEEDDSWNKTDKTKIRTPRSTTTTTSKNKHDDNVATTTTTTTKRRDHAEPCTSEILWHAQQYEQRARANKLSSMSSQQPENHHATKEEWTWAQRRQWAYQWYMRHGMPNRWSMLDQIERGIPL